MLCNSLYPSKLQQQNVQLVLNVFNDRIVAALKLQEAGGTPSFIQQSLNWWNHVNISAEGQAARIIDPSCCIQHQNSTNFLVFVKNSKRKS